DRAVPSRLAASAAPAVSLQVSPLGHSQAGATSLVRVVALDAANHRVHNYHGTVHLASDDAATILPLDYTFRRRDHGAHFFRVTFGTAGTETLTVTDKANGQIAGSKAITVVAGPVADHFLVVTPRQISVGDTARV